MGTKPYTEAELNAAAVQIVSDWLTSRGADTHPVITMEIVQLSQASEDSGIDREVTVTFKIAAGFTEDCARSARRKKRPESKKASKSNDA